MPANIQYVESHFVIPQRGGSLTPTGNLNGRSVTCDMNQITTCLSVALSLSYLFIGIFSPPLGESPFAEKAFAHTCSVTCIFFGPVFNDLLNDQRNQELKKMMTLIGCASASVISTLFGVAVMNDNSFPSASKQSWYEMLAIGVIGGLVTGWLIYKEKDSDSSKKAN